MLKKVLIFLIVIYQNFLSYFFKTLVGSSSWCRYEITCSEYAKRSIEKHGALRGTYLSIKRLLSCQPFYNSERSFAKWA